MKNFFALLKKQGLYINPETSLSTNSNELTVQQFEHELFKYGYVLSPDLKNVLVHQHVDDLNEIYSDIKKGLEYLFGGSGYQPTYKKFPASVENMSQFSFVMNAIHYYMSNGRFSPDTHVQIKTEFKLEPGNIKVLKLLSVEEFNSIFTDIIYSGSSITAFDKTIVDWFFEQRDVEINLSKISFSETRAYIGQMLFKYELPFKVRSATDVLRVCTAYFGGDEGLKANVKFGKFTNKQKKILREALNECTDLEESFKLYKEKWIRLLFKLNPTTFKHTTQYPELAKYTLLVRNDDKKLRTFASYIEEALTKKDENIFSLLKRRKGVFARRLDHLVRVFGVKAVDEYVSTKPSYANLIELHNHFITRTEENVRTAILANSTSSTVTNYGSLAALPADVVHDICKVLWTAMQSSIVKDDRKVYIDRSLYYAPLQKNNRASSFSLAGRAKGTVTKLPIDASENKIVRAYVHWHGRNDIDLSGMVITKDNEVIKVGWNGQGNLNNAILYSGDNTGHAEQNAEYIDINIAKLPANIEWIIVDAKVFRGQTYKNWSPKAGVYAGWMTRKNPKAETHWLPSTVENAMKVEADSKSVYLFAIHKDTANLVFLDVSQAESNVTTAADAIKFRAYLNNIVMLDSGEDEISWEKLGQGHALHMLANHVVFDKEDADVVFDENTTWERVSRAITEMKF